MHREKINTEKNFEDLISNFLKDKKAQTLDQCIQLINKQFSLNRDQIISILKNLQKKEKIKLNEPILPKISPQSFKQFLSHSMNYDLWLSILFVLITIPLALLIPENALESGNGLIIFLGVVRLIIGTAFIVFLPGYAVYTVLWPLSEKEDLTRFGIAFGLSLVIIPIIGLVLNFTPFGLTLISILTTVAIFTVVVLCIAFLRRFQKIS